MFRYVYLLFILTSVMYASVLKSPVVTVDEEAGEATISIERIDVGMSGFIIHALPGNHASILKEVVVSGYDEKSQIATLKMSDFALMRHSALPKGNWHVEVGDIALLAFGYSRALLIAPSEEIYHRVTKASSGVQWLHPDIFATILSINGHPSPLKEDFDKMTDFNSVGVIFFFLEQKLFTVDAKTFKILNISDAPLKQESEQHPFYSRVTEIDAAWWGAGSDPIGDYETYYYKFLTEFNEENQELHKIYSEFQNKK